MPQVPGCGRPLFSCFFLHGFSDNLIRDYLRRRSVIFTQMIPSLLPVMEILIWISGQAGAFIPLSGGLDSASTSVMFGASTVKWET